MTENAGFISTTELVIIPKRHRLLIYKVSSGNYSPYNTLLQMFPTCSTSAILSTSILNDSHCDY